MMIITKSTEHENSEEIQIYDKNMKGTNIQIM